MLRNHGFRFWAQGLGFRGSWTEVLGTEVRFLRACVRGIEVLGQVFCPMVYGLPESLPCLGHPVLNPLLRTPAVC